MNEKTEKREINVIIQTANVSREELKEEMKKVQVEILIVIADNPSPSLPIIEAVESNERTVLTYLKKSKGALN